MYIKNDLKIRIAVFVKYSIPNGMNREIYITDIGTISPCVIAPVPGCHSAERNISIFYRDCCVGGFNSFADVVVARAEFFINFSAKIFLKFCDSRF